MIRKREGIVSPLPLERPTLQRERSVSKTPPPSAPLPPNQRREPAIFNPQGLELASPGGGNGDPLQLTNANLSQIIGRLGGTSLVTDPDNRPEISVRVPLEDDATLWEGNWFLWLLNILLLGLLSPSVTVRPGTVAILDIDVHPDGTLDWSRFKVRLEDEHGNPTDLDGPLMLNPGAPDGTLVTQDDDGSYRVEVPWIGDIDITSVVLPEGFTPPKTVGELAKMGFAHLETGPRSEAPGTSEPFVGAPIEFDVGATIRPGPMSVGSLGTLDFAPGSRIVSATGTANHFRVDLKARLNSVHAQYNGARVYAQAGRAPIEMDLSVEVVTGVDGRRSIAIRSADFDGNGKSLALGSLQFTAGHGADGKPAHNLRLQDVRIPSDALTLNLSTDGEDAFFALQGGHATRVRGSIAGQDAAGRQARLRVGGPGAPSSVDVHRLVLGPGQDPKIDVSLRDFEAELVATAGGRTLPATLVPLPELTLCCATVKAQGSARISFDGSSVDIIPLNNKPLTIPIKLDHARFQGDQVDISVEEGTQGVFHVRSLRLRPNRKPVFDGSGRLHIEAGDSVFRGSAGTRVELPQGSNGTMHIDATMGEDDDFPQVKVRGDLNVKVTAQWLAEHSESLAGTEITLDALSGGVTARYGLDITHAGVAEASAELDFDFKARGRFPQQDVPGIEPPKGKLREEIPSLVRAPYPAIETPIPFAVIPSERRVASPSKTTDESSNVKALVSDLLAALGTFQGQVTIPYRSFNQHLTETIEDVGADLKIRVSSAQARFGRARPGTITAEINTPEGRLIDQSLRLQFAPPLRVDIEARSERYDSVGDAEISIQAVELRMTPDGTPRIDLLSNLGRLDLDVALTGTFLDKFISSEVSEEVRSMFPEIVKVVGEEARQALFGPSPQEITNLSRLLGRFLEEDESGKEGDLPLSLAPERATASIRKMLFNDEVIRLPGVSFDLRELTDLTVRPVGNQLVARGSVSLDSLAFVSDTLNLQSAEASATIELRIRKTENGFEVAQLQLSNLTGKDVTFREVIEGHQVEVTEGSLGHSATGQASTVTWQPTDGGDLALDLHGVSGNVQVKLPDNAGDISARIEGATVKTDGDVRIGFSRGDIRIDRMLIPETVKPDSPSVFRPSDNVKAFVNGRWEVGVVEDATEQYLTLRKTDGTTIQADEAIVSYPYDSARIAAIGRGDRLSRATLVENLGIVGTGTITIGQQFGIDLKGNGTPVQFRTTDPSSPRARIALPDGTSLSFESGTADALTLDASSGDLSVGRSNFQGIVLQTPLPEDATGVGNSKLNVGAARLSTQSLRIRQNGFDADLELEEVKGVLNGLEVDDLMNLNALAFDGPSVRVDASGDRVRIVPAKGVAPISIRASGDANLAFGKPTIEGTLKDAELKARLQSLTLDNKGGMEIHLIGRPGSSALLEGTGKVEAGRISLGPEDSAYEFLHFGKDTRSGVDIRSMHVRTGEGAFTDIEGVLHIDGSYSFRNPAAPIELSGLPDTRLGSVGEVSLADSVSARGPFSLAFAFKQSEEMQEPLFEVDSATHLAGHGAVKLMAMLTQKFQDQLPSPRKPDAIQKTK